MHVYEINEAKCILKNAMVVLSIALLIDSF